MLVAASSSSSSSPYVLNLCKYDIFISFRGEDTRKNFTSHLYEALCQSQIETQIGEEGLKRGQEISPALLRAIEESKISIIIFSKDYGSSRWCLDELVHMVKCKTEKGQIVLPVFYDVDPSDIRKQRGTYGDAFAEHEKRFDLDKVKEWRDALTAAANLSGFPLGDQ